MTKFDEISRWLSAAGASLSLDGSTTSLIFEGDNTLFAKTWSGSEFSDPVWIAAGVKTGTSAACVSDLAVFAIDENNSLRCYVKPEDESIDEDDTWPEKSLAGGNITVHSDSQLAINATPARITVFFQDLDGCLSAIQKTEADQSWGIVELPSTDSAPGTPILFHSVDEKQYLFYITSDKTVHRLVRDTAQGEWKDEIFSTAHLKGLISKITVAEEGEAENADLLVFCLIDNKLALVRHLDDKAEILGTVTDGQFRADKDEECVPGGVYWRPQCHGYGYGYGQNSFHMGNNYGTINISNYW